MTNRINSVKDELEAKYHEGLWVFHKKFGTGVVVGREEQCALVQFDAGVKKIIVNSDKLSPLILDDVFCYQGLQYRRLPNVDQLALVGVDNPTAAKIDIPDRLHINGRDYPVTTIGELAFANLKRLTDIYIPESVKDISHNAFYGSDKIRQVRAESCGNESATFVINEAGLWGVLANPARKVDAIPCQFDDIRFYAGYMVEKQRRPTFYFLVRQNGLWGIINKTGYQLVPCIYDALSPKEDNCLCIGFEYRQGIRSGLIDANGKDIVNP